MIADIAGDDFCHRSQPAASCRGIVAHQRITPRRLVVAGIFIPNRQEEQTNSRASLPEGTFMTLLIVTGRSRSPARARISRPLPEPPTADVALASRREGNPPRRR